MLTLTTRFWGLNIIPSTFSTHSPLVTWVDHQLLVIKLRFQEELISSTAQLESLITVPSHLVLFPMRLKHRSTAKRKPFGLIHKTKSSRIVPTTSTILTSRTSLTHAKRTPRINQDALSTWTSGIRVLLHQQLLEEVVIVMTKLLFSSKLHVSLIRTWQASEDSKD